MKQLTFVVFAALAAAPTFVAAADAKPQPPLELKPKAALSTVAIQTTAPFVNLSNETALDLLPRPDQRLEQSRSSCSSERSLCYDPGSGRIVYKPARALMPELPGLQPENISVKRDRIIFRYSF